MKRSTANQGFTLVELMVSIAIVGLLAILVIPSAELVLQRNQEMELRRALREIRTALDAYKHASDEGRIVLSMGDSGYPKNLRVLVQGVEDQRSPTRDKIYFLRRIPRDPFADESMDAEDTWGLRSYRSPPEAPRSGKDVFDVYSKSDAVGLNGRPYREW